MDTTWSDNVARGFSAGSTDTSTSADDGVTAILYAPQPLTTARSSRRLVASPTGTNNSALIVLVGFPTTAVPSVMMLPPCDVSCVKVLRPLLCVKPCAVRGIPRLHGRHCCMALFFAQNIMWTSAYTVSGQLLDSSGGALNISQSSSVIVSFNMSSTKFSATVCSPTSWITTVMTGVAKTIDITTFSYRCVRVPWLVLGGSCGLRDPFADSPPLASRASFVFATSCTATHAAMPAATR